MPTRLGNILRAAEDHPLDRTQGSFGFIDSFVTLYRVAEVVIVPSIYEPFGLVALEAMASGCLCVVADTGGLREVVPDGGAVGLRFPSRDSDALGRITRHGFGDAHRSRAIGVRHRDSARKTDENSPL